MLKLIAALLPIVMPAPAQSEPMPVPPPLHGGPQQMVCPVGGERFTAWQANVVGMHGERPDGRPYSYLPFPLPLPECPSNGLVVSDDFAVGERARLVVLIATPDYARLRRTETSYYRAYWLATRLGRPEATALGLLLAASWHASPDPSSGPGKPGENARFRAYQLEFVERARQLGPDVDLAAHQWIEARAANALRQLGQFGEAEKLRRRALGRAAGSNDWGPYLEQLKVVIARRDASLEPLDMIPDDQLDRACEGRSFANAFERATCAKHAAP